MNTAVQTQQKNVVKEALRQDKSLFQLPKEGDLVEGNIIGRESGALYIDLGAHGTGVIFGKEYYQAQDLLKKVKVGEKISAKIVLLENEDGYRELSLKEAGEEMSWNVLKQKQQTGELIDVRITDANRGGLMTEVEGMVGFLPVSQLTPAHYPRVEGGDKEKILEELKKFIGQIFHVRVLDSIAKENKLIVSEKAAENDAIQVSLAKYKVGDVVEGTITGVVDFGAFIKFDPLIEGLIHISELDWQLIENPRDVVSVGDKVQAKIVDISAEGRVSLSLKALKQDPWTGMESRFKKGDNVSGEIKRVHSYGALVRLDENIQGLLHVSEFGDEEAMRKAIHEGETRDFEVLSIDSKEHRIALKLKA
ncbi:MAG: S1 RNA-binding domain-containing protein [Candidatus Spechtbacteria bacterium]|nr:S1 RNA-binding domain-containing protein [Candidatus Spechtbacteria bacterium]